MVIQKPEMGIRKENKKMYITQEQILKKYFSKEKKIEVKLQVQNLRI